VKERAEREEKAGKANSQIRKIRMFLSVEKKRLYGEEFTLPITKFIYVKNVISRQEPKSVGSPKGCEISEIANLLFRKASEL
jgi:hypothetical protein